MPDFDKEAYNVFNQVWSVLEKSSKANYASEIMNATLQIHSTIRQALSKAYDKGYKDAFNKRFSEFNQSQS
jgi:hypothetical protein